MLTITPLYIEITHLKGVPAKEVITHTKSIFARHEILEAVISDNGPQFALAAYCQFAQDFQFEHITSSPYFPQSNGEAERAVGTIKSTQNYVAQHPKAEGDENT